MRSLLLAALTCVCAWNTFPARAESLIEIYASLGAQRGAPISVKKTKAEELAALNEMGAKFCGHVNFGQASVGGKEFKKTFCEVLVSESGQLTIKKTIGVGPPDPPEKFSMEERVSTTVVNLAEIRNIANDDGLIIMSCRNLAANRCVIEDTTKPSKARTASTFLEFPVELRPSRATTFIQLLSQFTNDWK